MANRPNPQDFKRESLSPTKILNQTVTIKKVQQAEYEGKPQLRCVVSLDGDDKEYDLYVSNVYVSEFLEVISSENFLPNDFVFFKSDPRQRHYEIAWADEFDSNEGIPF